MLAEKSVIKPKEKKGFISLIYFFVATAAVVRATPGSELGGTEIKRNEPRLPTGKACTLPFELSLSSPTKVLFQV